MRLAALFLRSRRAGRAVAVLVAAAAVCWALTLFLVSQTPHGVARGGLTLLLVFGALAAACVVGAASASPFGEAERTVSRPLAPLRLAHLAGLLLWSALCLAVALLLFDLDGARPEHPLLVLVRNVALLGGMALLSARMLGGRLYWVPPFVLSVGHLTAMGSGSDVLSAFANRSYYGLHVPSWSVAVLVLFLGLGMISGHGARETPAEAGQDA